MLKAFIVLILLTSALFSETLVFVRHAEKPEGGLGQLTCQGFNRSVHLPAVLTEKFGKPDFIFTSDPSELKKDKGTEYSYVRPLATLEPTAIKYGLPIHDQFKFRDVSSISSALLSKEYANSTIYVAWEHHLLVAIVKSITKKLDIPDLADDDYDSIYVVKIDSNGITFSIEKQNLNDLSKECIF
jgi:hypothetical protein